MQSLVDNTNQRILVIDDNPAIHEDFSKILALNTDQGLADAEADFFGEANSSDVQLSVQIDSASQGQEGLEKVISAISESRPYALAFVDMRMPPGWDGLTTIENLWEKAPDLQVVICTAYSDNTWSDICERLGKTDRLLILKKPFDNAEVCQLVLALTEKWSLTKQAKLKQEDLEKLVEERTNKLREAEASLYHMQKLEAIGELAAGIAHEINTPMQFVNDNIEYLSECSEKLFEVIGAYHRNLHDEGSPKNWRDRIEEIQRLQELCRFDHMRREIPSAIEECLEGVHRVIDIVRAMKQLSHPGKDEKTSMDINSAIQSTATITKNRWKYAADLEMNLAPDLPQVGALSAEINQVLINLVVNAADAIAERYGESGEKGKICIRTKKEADKVVIEVEDDGGGIPDDVKTKIFQPFFTTKEVGKGTGQGLAISHNVIVNHHHGSLEVQTEPEKGSCFIVKLPIETSETGPA